MKLSVIVVSYNMARELPRTIRSLSGSMQRGISPQDYEVIVIDNGSKQAFDEAACRRWLPELIVHHMKDATVSPVPAINKGLEIANGDLVGVLIDGARMASPGMLASALMASRLHARPAVGTLSFHLGREVQMQSVRKGYDQRAEDALLESCGWEGDGYCLFDISVFAGSSHRGWFHLPAESNALFLKPADWEDIGGYDEAFAAPGGGLANLDTWKRICDDESFFVVMLLGEATFHQVHGGIATNSVCPPMEQFHAEYQRIRGRAFTAPARQPHFFGSLAPQALRSIERSASPARGDGLPVDR
jgi:glycosyltransferase involved in cell wall biosynthesis